MLAGGGARTSAFRRSRGHRSPLPAHHRALAPSDGIRLPGNPRQTCCPGLGRATSFRAANAVADTLANSAPRLVLKTNRTIHVIGAGLAGLSAAVRLASAGLSVVVHELARHAGGRCRSYFEPALGLTIDNGNHLLLSGNHAAMAFLKTIGAEKKLVGPRECAFTFADLVTGERWQLRPNNG